MSNQNNLSQTINGLLQNMNKTEQEEDNQKVRMKEILRRCKEKTYEYRQQYAESQEALKRLQTMIDQVQSHVTSFARKIDSGEMRSMTNDAILRACRDMLEALNIGVAKIEKRAQDVNALENEQHLENIKANAEVVETVEEIVNSNKPELDEKEAVQTWMKDIAAARNNRPKEEDTQAKIQSLLREAQSLVDAEKTKKNNILNKPIASNYQQVEKLVDPGEFAKNQEIKEERQNTLKLLRDHNLMLQKQQQEYEQERHAARRLDDEDCSSSSSSSSDDDEFESERNASSKKGSKKSSKPAAKKKTRRRKTAQPPVRRTTRSSTKRK